MEKKLINAPIDGKNIMDEFDWLHDNDYTETLDDRKHRLAFYNCGLLWQLEYSYGMNTLRIYTEEIDSGSTSLNRSMSDIISRVENLKQCNEGLEIVSSVKVAEGSCSIYVSFYFVEED